MRTSDAFTKKLFAQEESPRGSFGLISETDFYRCELYGLEVDLTGSVIIPELCPILGPMIGSQHYASGGDRAVERFTEIPVREVMTCLVH